MDCDKFLNLLAAMFGVVGALYVVHGVITMSPELMFRLVRTHYDFSEPLMEAQASQKADNLIGFVFVLIAFVLTALPILFPLNHLRRFKRRLSAVAMAAVVAVSVSMLLYFVGEHYSHSQKLAIGTVATLEYVDEMIARRLDSSDSHSILFYAKLLELDVLPGESTRSLMQRVAGKVGKTLPPNLDYSAVEPKQ
jgi:hypothetical protein